MDDLISRQTAIDALKNMCSEDEDGITVSRANVDSMLRVLPSAQSERKKGNLIIDMEAEALRCGICGGVIEGCIRKEEEPEEDVSMLFGDRLAKLLQERHITQREFAGRIGCTEVSMSRYINNNRTPKATAIVQMAKALHITTDELLGVRQEGEDHE